MWFSASRRSLSCAHILFIAGVIPFSIVENLMVLNMHYEDTVYPYPFGALFCSLSHYLQFVLCYVTVYTLGVMSLDLYIAVRFRSACASLCECINTIYCTYSLFKCLATRIDIPNRVIGFCLFRMGCNDALRGTRE